MAEDKGWAGAWDPIVVDEATLDKLRELAGEPVLMKNGRPNRLCAVNLMNGMLTYPARSD